MKRLLALTLVLLLAACGGPSQPEYHVGTEGVVLSFAHDTPPREVYEDSRIPVLLEVSNLGAWDVRFEDIVVNLTGDPFYVAVQNARMPKDQQPYALDPVLYGKQPGYPEGEFITIQPNVTILNVTGPREQPRTQLFATICYPYATVLGTTVCVDSNAYNQNEQRQVCSATTLTYRSQGAPVAVVSIENRPAPIRVSQSGGRGYVDVVQPTFIVHVENLGTGRVLQPIPDAYSERLAVCGGHITTENLNKIEINATLSGIQLDCQPWPIELRDDKGYTTCVVPPSETSALSPSNYLGALKLTLSYMYQDSTSADISILRRGYVGDWDDYTIPERDDHPGFIEGEAKCEYCQRNPSDSRCDWPDNVNQSRYFQCVCGKEECRDKAPDGECIFGTTWCPGSNYCCVR